MEKPNNQVAKKKVVDKGRSYQERLNLQRKVGTKKIAKKSDKK